MTDIWRGFVAQRIAWENGWRLLFHSATVRQQRNEHAILRDFEDEIPGYLSNRQLVAELERLDLKAGPDFLADNMRICYEHLVRNRWIEKRELPVLEMWLRDLQHLTR